MLTRKGHARRQLLQSSAHAALLYLPLMRMFRETEALAQEGTLPNAVFAYWPTGYCGEFWPSGTNLISEVLKPIENAKLQDKFLLLDGLKFAGSHDHNGGPTQVLAGWGGASKKSGIGIPYNGNPINGGGENILGDLDPKPYSLDQRLAKLWNTPTVNVGIATKKTAFYTGLSWGEGGVETFSRDNPKDVFDKYFGNVQVGGGSTSQGDAAKKLATGEKKLLDFLKADIKRIENGLGSEDKAQFNAHVAALTDIENDINKIITGAPTMMANNSCNTEALKSAIYGMSGNEWYYKTENIGKVFELARALIVQALACNITRVAFYQIGTGHVEGTQLCPPDVTPKSNFDHHTISHDHPDQYKKIQTGHINQIAKIATDLDAIGLFKNTLIYGATDSGSVGHPPDRVPAFFLGDLNGKFKSGRKLAMNGKTYNSALVTMAHLVGATSINTVGNLKVTGPIKEII